MKLYFRVYKYTGEVAGVTASEKETIDWLSQDDREFPYRQVFGIDADEFIVVNPTGNESHLSKR